MVNFGPLAAVIISLVWGTPANFNWFRILAALLHGTLVVGVSQTAALNRGHNLCSAERPSRWALAHILVITIIIIIITNKFLLQHNQTFLPWCFGLHQTPSLEEACSVLNKLLLTKVSGQSKNVWLCWSKSLFVITTTHTTSQTFYSPSSGTTRVSRCQKRTSGLYGAREN